MPAEHGRSRRQSGSQGGSNLAPCPVVRPSPDPDRPAPEGVGTDALSITEFYNRVDRALRSAFSSELWITGEIRTMKVLPKGHCFIDLVDPTNAQDSGAPTLNVKCWSTRWRSVRTTLDSLGITLDAGMVVRARGKVEFYKARGTVDFILSELDTDALLGKVAAERARLIKALVDEGLFDRQRGLRVAALPLRVGLVASPDTEGYHDFLGGLRSSGMAFEVTVAPTAVQGKVAPGPGRRRHLEPAGRTPRRHRRRAGRGIQGRPGRLRPGACGPRHRHLCGPGLDRHRPHRRPVGRRRSGQPLVHHPDRVRAGAGPPGHRLLEAGRRRRCRGGPDGPRSRSWPPTGSWPPANGRWPSVRVPNSTAMATDSVTGPARYVACRRGQLDTHALRLSARGEALTVAARRGLRAEGEALVGRSTRLAALPGRKLLAEDQRLDQWRRLLGAYDYQRQLERGYSVTRDASGRVVRSVHDVGTGARLRTRVSDGELVSTVEETGTSDPASRNSTATTHHDEGTQ